MFAKFTRKHLFQRLYFNKVAGLRLWHKCFPVNLWKFLRTLFLQNSSGRLLLLLASQKQPPDVFYEKKCSWNFCKIHKKTPVVCEFLKNTFFTEHFWNTASGFSKQLSKKGALPTVFGKPQMNTLYLETLTLEVPFRYVISFSAAYTFSVCFHWSTLITTISSHQSIVVL